MEHLEKFASEILKQGMTGVGFDAKITRQTVKEGASALIVLLKKNGVDQIAGLFESDVNSEHVIMDVYSRKLSKIMIRSGVNEEIAKSKSSNMASAIVNGLRRKFDSNAAADRPFDMHNIFSLLSKDKKDVPKTKKIFFGD